MKSEAIFASCLILALTLGAPAPNPSDLLRQLQNPNTAVAAEAKLEQVASSDRKTRDLLSVELPLLLGSVDLKSRPSIDQAGVYAKLAGKLRLVRTIPALGKLVQQPKTDLIDIDFYRFFELIGDPFSLALVQIGEPAIPELNILLNDPQMGTRSRATRALLKIGSPAARTVLREQLPKEGDSPLAAMITASVGPAR